MIKAFVIVAVLLSLVFGSIFGFKAWQQQQVADMMAAAGPRSVTVSSTLAEVEQWALQVNTVGSLRAIQGIEVSAEVAGVVETINFESGGQIKAGANLLQLDATAELAELRSLEAQLALARQDYNRAKGLEVKTVLSQAQLDRAKSVQDSLAAQAEEQQALIDRKTVLAPFSGELGIREVSLGEYLSPGSPIVTLQQLDPIFVDFTVQERYLSLLGQGQTVEIRIAAYPNDIFKGKISAISPRVLSETRNIELQATLQNPEGRLRPGMFTQVSVLLGGYQDVVTLPRNAVDFLPYGNSVFLILDDGESLTVQRRQVQTGRVMGNRVEIIEGLDVGERVVGTGQLKLRNGQLININNVVKLPGGATAG